MGKQSFSIWLTNEVATSRYALLALLEKRDRLLYFDAPALRREYMAKIGSFEEEVLESELTVSQLERKIELIQATINRREPVDMDRIDAQLILERSEKLSELEASDKTASELRELSDGEAKELQKKYRSIVHDFHPQVNSGITDTQRDLYEKALEAYKRQNIEAIRIIFDMLYDISEPEALTAFTATEEEQKARDIQSISDALASDYSLAKELYSCFSETEVDAVLKSSSIRCKQQRTELEAEIKSLQSGFPFNARDTLRSQKLTDEYLSELKVRLRQSEEKKKDLTNKIESMIGAVENG